MIDVHVHTQVSLKYMSASIQVGMEAGVVAIGPLVNILFFLGMSIGGYGFYRVRQQNHDNDDDNMMMVMMVVMVIMLTM